MTEHPPPVIVTDPASPMTEPVRKRGAHGLVVRNGKWLHLAVLCGVCALIGYRGGGDDKLATWQAMLILGAALLAGSALATQNWRQGISAGAFILLLMGGGKLAGWATGGWTGGLPAASVGAVVGATLGAPLCFFPRHPLFGRDSPR